MWRSLRHKFVLPLLGIYRNEPMEQFFLVSPYMKNGTLAQWRKKANPSIAKVEERVCLLFPSCCSWMLTRMTARKILEVAKGIEYIHSEDIVHGDLRGVFYFKHNMTRYRSFSAGQYPLGCPSSCSNCGLWTNPCLRSYEYQIGSTTCQFCSPRAIRVLRGR